MEQSDVLITDPNKQAVFQVGDRFWVRQKINIFFQDKFYSLKAHGHYFTVLIYLAT